MSQTHESSFLDTWLTRCCSYDMIKQLLITRFDFRDAIPTHLLTSILGGTIAVTACAPIDVFKSRIQSAPHGVVSRFYYQMCHATDA